MLLPVRYAIRQALNQEYQRYLIRQSAGARQARYEGRRTLDQNDIPDAGASRSGPVGEDKISKASKSKCDFFGRIIQELGPSSSEGIVETKAVARLAGNKVWVSFHEGFSK